MSRSGKEIRIKKSRVRRGQWGFRRRRRTGCPSVIVLAGFCVLGIALGLVGGYILHYRIINRPGGAPDASGIQDRVFTEPLDADPEKVSETITHLSENIGERVAGSEAEAEAIHYLKDRLEEMGYEVGKQDFILPDGRTSSNLITADPGTSSEYTFIVAAHVDTDVGTPGANSNASGCAALLELARITRGTKHISEIRFIIFGGQEESLVDGSTENGSIAYLGSQDDDERAKIVGMTSIDTVAVGELIGALDAGKNSAGLASSVLEEAKKARIPVAQYAEPSSDHRPFGEAGIPAVWITRMPEEEVPDGNAGTSYDKVGRASVDLIADTANVLRNFILSRTEAYCSGAKNR